MGIRQVSKLPTNKVVNVLIVDNFSLTVQLSYELYTFFAYFKIRSAVLNFCRIYFLTCLKMTEHV